MTSSIFNWAIDKFLSKFLEINKDETKISLWNGSVEMSNVKIKSEIFTTMNLPYFELVNGYIGKIKLVVSLPRFYLYPIKVVVEKVFFHAKQKKLETINKKTEIENMEAYKDSQLLSMEELANEVKNLQSEGGPGYVDQIINNLEIEIKDICVRFDDDLSYNLIPFTFGLLLKNLKIKTVDEDFKEPKEGETIPIGEVGRKILKMDNFSIYLDTYENDKKLVEYFSKIVNDDVTQVKDEKLKTFLGPMLQYYRYCLSETEVHINDRNAHQYLNYNSGFEIKLAMNQNLKNGDPQYAADCQLNNLLLSMSLVQIKAAMKLLAYQDLNAKYQLGLSKEYYVKVLKEEDKITYIDSYIEYFKAKYTKKDEKQAKILEPVLRQIEKGLKYNDIQVMRDAAKYKMFHDTEIDNIDEKIKQLESGTGFWSYFSYSPTEEQKKEIQKLKEQKNKLMKENIDQGVKDRLSKSGQSNEVDTLKDIPDNFCLYRVILKLPLFSLDINKQNNEKMISIESNNFQVKGEIRKKGQFFSLLIDDIFVKQYQLKNNNMYETIMATIEQKDDKPKKEGQVTKGACYIEFENNPSFKNSNFRFKYRNTKRLIITVNLYSIQYIMNKVLDSLAATISKFGSERYIGSGEIQNLIKSGFETNYMAGGFQHFNIDLDIQMKSPIILYPQDILDPYNKKCLFIKFGDFEMKSELPPRQILEKNYDLSDNRKELFDIYTMKIENFSMFTLDEFKGDFNNLYNIKGLDLVENISVNFTLEQNFASKNKNFEKTKIVLNIGKCRFDLRDTQIIFFIELLAKMQQMNKKLSFDLEKKTTLFEIEEDKQNKEDLAKEEKEKEEIKEKEEEKEKKEKEKKEKEEKLNKLKEQENKKKQAEQELLLRLQENEDPNYLIFEFNIENIELSLMKSISLKERKILSQIDPKTIEDLKLDTKYRDFIVFSLNQFKIDVLTTEKGNMNVTISMESTSIKDKETIIISKDNPKGDILINKEFQDLIHMRAEERRRPPKELRNFLKKRSEIYGIQTIKEEKKVDENIQKKFMIIEYRYNGTNKNQEVNIVLQKIRICFSMSSMARLYQYYSYYYGMYSKSNDDVAYILAMMEEKEKKENLKDKMKFEKRLTGKVTYEKKLTDISDISDISNDTTNKNEEFPITKFFEKAQGTKKIFGEKFVQNLSKDIKVLGKDFNNIISTASNKQKQENEEEEKKEVEKLVEKEEEIETEKVREKSNMKINFEMKETRLDFPMDDTEDKTKVLRFNFNFISTILMNSEYDSIKNVFGRQIRINYITNNMKISAKCINVGFQIIHFRNGNYSIDNVCDKMLDGFRFFTNINSFLLLPHREKSVMAIDVIFEPLIFNIGFRQTKTLMAFLPKLSQFLTDMYKEYNDPLKELNDDEPKNEIILENENNIMNENTNIILGEKEENLTEEQLKKRRKKIEKYKIKQKQLEMEKKLKEKQKKESDEKQNKMKVISNTDGINNMMDVKVTFEKLSFKYLDDSGAYLIPLLNIESHDVLINYIQNSNPDSVENISNLIYESISRKEVELEGYDINGLFMYVQIEFDTSINFYNDRISNWEPIIERYSGKLKVDQATSFSRMRVLFDSEDMFNMNISISSMNVLNRVLKKFGESEEKWDKDLKELDEVKKSTNSRIAIEFINLSGIDIECWLDAKEEVLKRNKNNVLNRFKLEGNEEKNRKSIIESELNLYYKQLPEAQAKINKDKFSFRVRGYVPVYGNDFSQSHTSSFRIKKKKIAIDEIRPIYQRMKNSNQNQTLNTTDGNNNQIVQRSNSLAISEFLEDEEDMKSLINDQSEDLYTESNKTGQRGMVEKNVDMEIPIEKPVNLIEDEIEILVKVRQNGPTRSVIFQSNIFIFNNLQVPIYLSFISPEDYANKYGSNDANINHAENKDKILLNTCKRISVNLKYVLNKYRVYVSFFNKLNKDENHFVLLYENFTLLKEDLPNFIKYNQEIGQEEKKTILEDKYSKMLEIKQNNNSFYISCNLLLQKGNGDAIKEMPNITEKANKFITGDPNNKTTRAKNIDYLIDFLKHDFYSKTFSYVFILDESLLIENKIPFNIKCKLSGNNEKEMSIRPLQKKEFLDIDQSQTSVQFSFNYHDKKFVSDNLNIKELDKKNIESNKDYVEEKRQIKLFNEENKEEYLECDVDLKDDFNPANLVGAYEKEYEQSLRSFQNKKKLVIYTKCIFVNKSDNLLYILSEDEEKNWDKINKDNYNYKILPHSINLINVKDVKKPFKIRTEGSDWSNKFNINTVGNTGVTSLNLPDKDDKNKITILDMGISIPTSWYFTESLLITIVPRFLFVNKLGFDIEYKQYNNKINKEKNDKSDLFEKKELKNGESLNLNLLKANKNMKKMLQIKFECSKDFTCPFDLEDMGEIDLKIEIDEQMKKDIEKKNEKIEREIQKLKKLEKEKKEEDLLMDEIKKEQIAKKLEKVNNENEENVSDEDDEEEIILIKKDKKEDENEININKEEKVEDKDKNKEKDKELSPEEDRQKRLEEKNKLLEKYKLKPRKYIIFEQNHTFYLLVHITKSTQNGLINIILFPPKYPQYIISNESKHRLSFKQKKDDFGKEIFYLEPKSSIPYVWGDSLKNEKTLIVMLDKNDIELNLNEIKINKKKFEIKEKGKTNSYTFYFQTLVEKENYRTRKLVIKNETIKNKTRGYFLEVLKGKKKSVNMKFKVVTKGLGLSIINNEPKEIFYISAYGCTIEGNQFTFKREDNDHSITNVMFILKNFQIDYCLEDNFKSMLVPLNPVTPIREEDPNVNKDDLVPLFQGIISFHSATNPSTQISSDEIPQIDFTIQPIKFNVTQFQLISLMSLYQEIIPELDFFLVTPEPHEEYNNIEELLNSLFGQEQMKKSELVYDPQYYDKNLDLSSDIIPEQIIYESENHQMFSIKNIHIGSIEIIMTTRMDLTAFKDMLPSYLVGIISAIGNVFLHITDYKLKFATSLYSDVFTDMYSLSDTLYNTYYRQLMRGLFRIIGSLDILGNPTGYASSIADGFMQIIEAPRKGLINGPLGVGEGIAKGFGKFITTIISSSFDVVGKISGTLLASCEVLQGEKVFEELEEREPEHILDGIYTGLKEGAIDLGKGIGGIFYKPFQGARKEGVKGFFKGLGSGVLGAVVSPFTALLRVTNNVFVGLKNTVNLLNPKLKTERFRYPRTIEKAYGLQAYDEDKATIKAILDYLKDYEGEEIIYFKQFEYISPGLENENKSYLILTNKCVLVVYKAKEVVFKLMVNHIDKIEIHKEENGVNFDIIFKLKDDSREYIKTKDVDLCTQFYLIFSNSN